MNKPAGANINPKYVVFGLVILVFVFAVVILSIFAVISYNPGLIGIQTESELYTTEEPPIFGKVDIEPTLLITKRQLSIFEKDAARKDILSSERDSLIQYTNMYKDSMNLVIRNFAVYQDSLTKIETLLTDSLRNINKYRDSIKALGNELTVAKANVERYIQRLEQQESFFLSRMDSLEVENFQDFAKIYNNANPQEVAKILQLLDERDAAKILKLMQAKQAGKVLEAMNPEQAATILLLGASP